MTRFGADTASQMSQLSKFSIQSLESRDHFAATWSPYTVETEPNSSPRTADTVPLGYDGVSRYVGVLRSTADRDVFRIKAWQAGTMQLDITQVGKQFAGVTVFNSSGNEIVATATTVRFHVRQGRYYLLSMKSLGDGVSRYSVLLRQDGLGVPASRIKTLSNGVNVPSWFWNQNYSDDPNNIFYTYFGDHDAKNLKDIGIKHIRLPVDTKYLVDWSNPGSLNQRTMAALNNAVSLLSKYGIAVMLSPFGDYNERVIDPASHDAVLTFVSAWAKHWSRFDPEKVFLQTANEPAGDPSLWLPMQKEVISVMRRAAPRHTIITATTLRYASDALAFGTIEAFRQQTPVPDPNVVYGFHFYEPYVFTAQGAEWAWPGYGYLRYVPYPSNTQNVQWLINALDTEITDPNKRFVIDTLKSYGSNYWDSEKLKSRIKLVSDWAKYWGKPVIMDEFGTIAENQVSSTDRNRWISDTRTIAESYGFGWSMWDYAAGYNLADGGWYSRTVRPDVVSALGLP